MSLVSLNFTAVPLDFTSLGFEANADLTECYYSYTSSEIAVLVSSFSEYSIFSVVSNKFSY